MSEENKKEKFEFGVEAKKILKLMIHSLYTNKDVVVRELISNASDACDKLKYKANTDDSLWGDDKDLKIKIKLDEKEKTLSIIDNGIGMDKQDLINQLGVIAKSGTEAFLKNLSNDDEKNIQLIGQFGVGFYSSFMIADKVKVISRKAGKNKVYAWESKGEGNYTVEEVKESYPRGTSVILYLKAGEDEYIDKVRIQNIVKTYSDHINIPVELILDDGKEKVINNGTALWTKPKDSITEEQYNEFYKHLAHLGGKPFMTLHNKAEGIVEFTNLLFIPDKPPFDLFHPDNNSRIKLYVKKVFITDDAVQLLPRFLRFVYGIVDSEDLPLNISRQTLQYNNVVEKIKHSLTKRVLNELEKKSQKEPEEYEKFWNNFGQVLKEGLCEGGSLKDDILKICKFYTSKSEGKLIGLDEYISRMKADQENIYYINGSSLKNIENSPQLEGFKSKDIEVLYLVDTVDNFWVTATNDYNGKKFSSITRANIDPEKKKEEEQEDNDDIKFDDKKEEKKNPQDVTNTQFEAIIKLFKEVLQDKVKDVVISKKLTNSPICIVADENAIDIRLERFLLEQKQLVRGVLKILEINPKNKIIENLVNDLSDEKKLDKVKEKIKILYDEACILEGEPLENPMEFAKFLNNLLEKE